MIKVLIYEDDFNFRETLCILVNATESFELKGAFEHCNQISDHLIKYMPDVILMDIDMPGIGGLEGLRIVRGAKSPAQVLMLTIFDSNENIFKAICHGANGYLLKKSAPSKIIEAIQEVHDGGAPFTPSIARKILELFPKTPARSNEIDKLSIREKEILELIMKGFSYKMVAAELIISVETVRTFVKRIYEKLHVHSAHEAINKIFPGRSF